MNIKFGMDNFYVRYLKRFLNHELTQSNTILGNFDRNDQSLLIKYLNLSNVKDMFTVQKEIVAKFPELNTLFNMKLKDNRIEWSSKEISEEISNFILDNQDDIEEYCEDVGWKVTAITEWIDMTKDINDDGYINDIDRRILKDIIYNGADYSEDIMKKADLNLDGVVNQEDLEKFEEYMNSGKLTIEIEKTNRENYFPNKDMLVFINQFDGTFMYNYIIRGDSGVDDIPHSDPTGLHKIALYQCTPGQKVTIAHNNTNTMHLVIGSSFAKLKQNIKSEMLQNVVEVDLAARAKLSIYLYK